MRKEVSEGWKCFLKSHLSRKWFGCQFKWMILFKVELIQRLIICSNSPQCSAEIIIMSTIPAPPTAPAGFNHLSPLILVCPSSSEYNISAAAIAIFSLFFMILGTLCVVFSFGKGRDYLLRPAGMFFAFAGQIHENCPTPVSAQEVDLSFPLPQVKNLSSAAHLTDDRADFSPAERRGADTLKYVHVFFQHVTLTAMCASSRALLQTVEQWRHCVCSPQASASSFLWRWCASRSSAWSPATRPSGLSTTTPGPSRAPVPPSPCSSWAAWPCSSSPCPTCRATPGRRAWTPSPTSWTEATLVLQLEMLIPPRFHPSAYLDCYLC